MAYGIPTNNESGYTCNITNIDHVPPSVNGTVRSSINTEASRFHSRSQSWSHTSWMQTQSTRNSNSSTMASIFSPIRVIQGIVPSLTDAVTGGSTNRVSSPTPQAQTSHRSQSIAVGTELPSDTAYSNSTHVRTRSDVSSRHSRQSSSVEIDLGDAELQQQPVAPLQPTHQDNVHNGMEFLGTITWMEKALPFALLLLSRIMWDHRIGKKI